MNAAPMIARSNRLLGLLFALIGVTDLARGEVWSSALWIVFGAGLLFLSTQPVTRRHTLIANVLIVLALGLFVVRLLLSR